MMSVFLKKFFILFFTIAAKMQLLCLDKNHDGL